MEAALLRREAVSLIDALPPNKIEYVIQFTKFLSQQEPIEKKVPIAKKKHLPLGFLKGKAQVQFADDWEMSEEELLGL